MPRQSPTPRQKKLIKQLPQVFGGEKTMQDAMLDAGYAKSTAHEQSRVLGQVGNNAIMQEELKKAGVTISALAKSYKEGIGATNDKENPDYHARFKFTKAATELYDAFPVGKDEIKVDGTWNVISKTPQADGTK